MRNIAILGAGMAGLGAAHHLFSEKISSVVYEKHSYHGGHATSFKFENSYIFDDGPHVSFTQNERLQKLFVESVNDKYEVIHTQVNNYWKGQWIKHPAQCNLYGLPKELVVKILKDFIDAQYKDHGLINNYADWLIAAFGKTFAETYPMEYGLKYHTTTADNMNTSWLGPRLYRPNLEEVLNGALSSETPDVHYVDYFRYPSHNGFASYLDIFLKQADLKLNHELIKLDPKKRMLYFGNGTTRSYDAVISSIPLPEIVPIIDGAPDDVLAAAEKLACTTCVVVNVVIDREDISNAHWSYFYDRDIFFTRLSFPHMLSPNNVPKGTGSIQAEAYYSKKYRPLDRSPEDCIHPIIRDLKKCNLIREDDQILFTNTWVIPYANVIFDLDEAEARETVQGYLSDIGIHYCGRYGEWKYIWTDQSFLSGEMAAQSVLDER
ncbi:MAG: FAD-dependent oxidoreductase [Proteobacteria bacterium]|nr:FAD-dependent oxidoreductase [Pseudomonadota bacterium]